jgi:hypothetical protein
LTRHTKNEGLITLIKKGVSGSGRVRVRIIVEHCVSVEHHEILHPTVIVYTAL